MDIFYHNQFSCRKIQIYTFGALRKILWQIKFWFLSEVFYFSWKYSNKYANIKKRKLSTYSYFLGPRKIRTTPINNNDRYLDNSYSCGFDQTLFKQFNNLVCVCVWVEIRAEAVKSWRHLWGNYYPEVAEQRGDGEGSQWGWVIGDDNGDLWGLEKELHIYQCGNIFCSLTTNDG